MIELIFTACLKTDPQACEQKILTYIEEGAGDQSCMTRAQPELAAWAGAHPAFWITAWKCEESSARKVDI